MRPAPTPRRRAESWLPEIMIVGTPRAASRCRAVSNNSIAESGGHRAVVHVPGDDHRFHLALAHGRHEVVDERGLGVEHRHPVEGPAQMPVGGVQQSHDPRD
ncbi:hypothetical protein GCM10020256_67010 [Streptomyces thermocoprophilus]